MEAGLVQILLSQRQRDAALQIAAVYLRYGRPGAVRSLQKRCLLPPLPSQVRSRNPVTSAFWVTNFAPQEDLL